MSKNLKETTLLDSSLISKYLKKELLYKSYSIKGYKCGDFVQIYFYQNNHFSKDKSFLDINKLDTTELRKKGSSNLRTIQLSNAIRSNLSVQRIARTNIKYWTTFITLTFADNVTDIEYANKKFNQFISNVRKLKKDFKYLAVPEFQKRGAVHYHLLSNLDIESGVIILQEDKKGRAINIDSLYDIKYWNFGFCRVDFIKGNYTKVFSYLCKYMTKDIDNRLFMKKRYFCSQNLDKYYEFKVNLSNDFEQDYFNNLVKDMVLDYNKDYVNPYNNELVTYVELKKEVIS